MHASNVTVGGRYKLKLFGSVRVVDVLEFQAYDTKERPKKIWTVVEVDTGKHYTVFAARSFLEKLEEGPKGPYPELLQQEQPVEVAQETATAVATGSPEPEN